MAILQVCFGCMADPYRTWNMSCLNESSADGIFTQKDSVVTRYYSKVTNSTAPPEG